MVVMGVACLAMAMPGTASAERRGLDLTIVPLTDMHDQPGPLERAFGSDTGRGQHLAALDQSELAVSAGSLGVMLRREDDKLKPDLFYDVSGWRLRTRIMSGDSPFEIEGMVLRAAHSFPLFGRKAGTADLP